MLELKQDFFAENTVGIARDLLGKIIEVNGKRARIVETEAYKQDKASHAYKKTERSKLMFDTYGHVYVYLVYGMYYCLNFTTEKDSVGAVLIRAVEYENCNGPGKLCKVLGIDKTHNGTKIGTKLKLFDDGYKVKKIKTSSRIGIKEGLHLQWRFYIDGNEFVSRF